MSEPVDPQIAEAIKSGVIAGACWRAMRIDRRSAPIWARIAERHHRQATACLSAIPPSEPAT